MSEHLLKYETKEKNSILDKHVFKKHNGDKQDIKLDIISSCGNDAMLRQVTGAVLIKELDPELNSKEEWRDSNAPRSRANKYNAS